MNTAVIPSSDLQERVRGPRLAQSRHRGLGADLAAQSPRERELLELIAEGYNNSEIAQKLYISPSTVSNHITSIFSKLQVADRAQAIRRARSGGLGA